jgi:hypothetical protein
MPRAVPDSIARLPGRTGWKLVAAPLRVILAAMLSTGCIATSSLSHPPYETVGPPSDELAGALASVPSPPATTDPAVVRASAVAQADVIQTPPGSPAEAVATELPPLADVDQPGPAGPVDVMAPFVVQPSPMLGGAPLYRYDPMRGAVLSPTPPPNRNVTLREVLGLGRSDIADKDVEVKPKYPSLHDDPLARSPVPPTERKPLLFPALSNLISEHDWELKGDGDAARDDVLSRRSDYDVTLPGPDTANFPNSPFTLPKGRAYIETSPVSFFGKARSTAAQYNWEFLLRYGLTDDLEFRIFSSGFSSTIGKPHTTGFSPLAFDFKYHLWDENLEKRIPAAGAEIFILTPFGSPYFNGGTQPSIALLLDHTLPFDILLEHNFGLTGLEDTFGGAVYEFSYQWALQRQVFKDLAVFTHGFLNSAALPRLPIFQRHIQTSPPSQVVVGGGFEWNLSKRLAIFGSYNAGLAADAPRVIALLGFSVAL